MDKESMEAIKAGKEKYGLTPLVEIDEVKALDKATMILGADPQSVFSDFVFKSIEYLEELEIQYHIVDKVFNANIRHADKQGFSPQEIEQIKENQELLTGNLKLAQTMLNNFLGAHYKSAYLKHGGER